MTRRLGFSLFAVVTLLATAFVLWRCTPAAGLEPSDAPSNKAEEPAKPAEPAPTPAADVPTGQIQPHGLEFKLPFDRGDGTLTFARQDGLLRVDALIKYPYYAGDAQRDRGSAFNISLSVSGLAGRQLLYYPSPIWQGGPPPLFRVEARYSKDEGTNQLNEEPTFGAMADVKSWDSWRVTLLIDLRMVVVPGNSPAGMAENWMAGIVAGNQAARIVFPKGMDQVNPAKTPGAMVRFKFSELPEIKDAKADAREKAIEREQEQQEAVRKLAAMIAQRNFTGLQQEAIKIAAKFPEQLWPKYLSYAIALTASRNGLEGVDPDFLAPMKAYVEGCPGQSAAHLEYLNLLLSLGKFDDATKHAAELMKSTLVTGSGVAGANISLRYAASLGQNGYLAEAAEALGKLDGNEFLAKDTTLSKLLTDAKTELAAKQAQWEAELKFQTEDAKKKNPQLTLDTTKGKVVIELFEDDAPNTVATLVSLTQAKFYDGLTFHRFVEGFVIQGGCPKGNGEGDPGYRIKSEVSRRNHFRGMVGMACTRPKTGTEGSQFYVCLTNNPSVKGLSGNYVIVGRVIEGMDAVDKLRAGDKMTTVTAGNLRDHPYKPETIAK